MHDTENKQLAYYQPSNLGDNDKYCLIVYTIAFIVDRRHEMHIPQNL